MKIQKKSSKKILLAAIATLIVLALGVGGLYAWSKYQDKANTTNTPTNEKATPEQINAGNDTKKDTVIKNSDGKPDSSNSSDDPLPPPDEKSVAVSITAANQNESTLVVRTLVELVTNDGTCELTLTNGSSVVTKTSGIQALARSSTCQGFDIPTSELSPGAWHLTLNVRVGTKSGSAEKDVVIN